MMEKLEKNAKVIPFSEDIDMPNVPVERIVKCLEEMLELAKQGEIVALGFAFIHPDKRMTEDFFSTAGNCCRLLAATSILHLNITEHLRGY